LRVSPEATQRRDYSSIERSVVGGQPVYVKHCLPGCRYQSDEAARDQVAREVRLLNMLAESPEFAARRRLGVVQVVEHNIQSSRITTAVVPGKLLSEVLSRGRSRTRLRSSLSALYLAGQWLRVFQSFPVDSDVPHATESNPEDLVEHCRLRLQRLRELGQTWPTAAAGEQLLHGVDSWLKSTPAEQRTKVWTHGDYGPYNLIWDNRTLTPIDFAAATSDVPLADVVYLVHRLEMLPVWSPWQWWPVAAWRRACLRGYGMPQAPALPLYRALMVRFLLSRLKKLAENEAGSWMGRWRKSRVIAKLKQLLHSANSPRGA
jgi:hypothetical protein